jgi:Fungal specific transcription factor domain
MRSQRLWQARNESIKLRQRQHLTSRTSPASLHQLLPSNEEIRQLVQVYWELMEVTFRVLHGPSFLSDLQLLLEDRQSCRESFVAVVLLAMATVRSMVHETVMPYGGPNSRWQASIACNTWIEACTKWLSSQSQELRGIESVQIRLLICIAIQITSSGSNRAWEEITSLLSYCISMGLHKDTATISQSFSVENAAAGLAGFSRPAIVPFEQEIRRRLWSTVVEMELQASFDRGLPSFAATIYADCGPPNNLADEDLDANITQLPKSVPDETYTHCSFLKISHRSLPLRAELNKLINDTSASLSFKEILAYDHKILQELQSLPDWTKSLQKSNAVNLPSVVAAMTLDIQLRQYLLPIHIPFAQQAEFNIRYSYSRLVCINTASIILEYHSRLSASGNSCLDILREDVFRAALCLCHHVNLWKALKCTLNQRRLKSSPRIKY